MNKKYGFIIALFALSPDACRAAAQAIPGVSASSTVIDFDDLDTPVQMVEQEFDPSILENLIPPTTAPAQVRLPPLTISANEWIGSQCGVGKPAHAVFRKASDWDKFWTLAIKPYLSRPIDTPSVDFSKDMVIGVFRGDDAFPGDLIKILGTKTEGGTADPILGVSFRNISRMQPVFIPPFHVQPFHLKKIPSFAGRVAFRQTKH